jgi:L-2-hydroxyglutarate oxidase
MCYHELRRSFSMPMFVESAQTLIPDLRRDDLETSGSGVRAQALTPQGQLAEDFDFQLGDHAVHVINAPSPAATAALAIGDVIADRVEEANNLHSATARSAGGSQ